MKISSLLLSATILASIVGSSGCATVMTPVWPAVPVAADGPPVAGLRFDGEATRISEPRAVVSPSRQWQREVSNFAAASLNRALSVRSDAPPATTTVTFDLAEPPFVAFGPSVDMGVIIESTLPDGRVVRSEPIRAMVDDSPEATALAAASAVSLLVGVPLGIAVLFTPRGYELPAVLGSALGVAGIISAAYFFEGRAVAAQEARWSDLFAEALRRHARDVRARLAADAAAPANKPPTLEPSDATAASPQPR